MILATQEKPREVKELIYTIDAKNNVLLSVMQQYFNLDNKQVYNTINTEFDRMVEILKSKKVDYNELKKALVPNQDKAKKEIAFVFDSTFIRDGLYGYYIFNLFIPLLGKDSTYSILAGDYIDIINNQEILRKTMLESINIKHVSIYQHSNQYFIIYLNNISKNQLDNIISGLKDEPSFFGTIDLTYTSLIKSYFANVLSPVCLVNKNKVIMGHESDRKDADNINVTGYPFESNGFSVISINDDLFMIFLSYKIECIMVDLEDIKFSLNTLCIDYSVLSDYQLVIDEEKFQYLNRDKFGILESVGFERITREEMSKLIFQKLSENYIYNLEYMNEYKVIKFNTCIELLTKSNRLRRTTIALEYIPAQKILRLITLT